MRLIKLDQLMLLKTGFWLLIIMLLLGLTQVALKQSIPTPELMIFILPNMELLPG